MKVGFTFRFLATCLVLAFPLPLTTIWEGGAGPMQAIEVVVPSEHVATFLDTSMENSLLTSVPAGVGGGLTEFEGGAAARMKLSQMAFPTKQTIRGRLPTIFRSSPGTPSVNSELASSAAWALGRSTRSV